MESHYQIDPIIQYFLKNNHSILQNGQIAKIQTIILHNNSLQASELIFAIRNALFNSNSFWTNVYLLLQNSTSQTSMIYWLITIKQKINNDWFILDNDFRNNLKMYIGKSIQQMAEMEQKETQQNPFSKQKLSVLKTLDQIVVQIIKCQWNTKWPNFIKDICQTAENNKFQALNSLRILRMVFQDIFIFPEKNMTFHQLSCLKKQVQTNIPIILKHVSQVWFQNQGSTKNRKMLKFRQCLQTINTLLSWIPCYFVFFSQILTIIKEAISIKQVRSLALTCFQEILRIKLTSDLIDSQNSIRSHLAEMIKYILQWVYQQNSKYLQKRPKNKYISIENNGQFSNSLNKNQILYQDPNQTIQKVSLNISLNQSVQKNLIQIFNSYFKSNFDWIISQNSVKQKKILEIIDKIKDQITLMIPQFTVQPCIQIFQLISNLQALYSRNFNKENRINQSKNRQKLNILLEYFITHYPRPPSATFYMSHSQFQIIRASNQFTNTLEEIGVYNIKTDEISVDKDISELYNFCSNFLKNQVKSDNFHIIAMILQSYVEILFHFRQYNIRKMNSFIWCYRQIYIKTNCQNTKMIIELIDILIDAKKDQFLAVQKEKKLQKQIRKNGDFSNSNSNSIRKKYKFNPQLLLQSLTMHLLIQPQNFKRSYNVLLNSLKEKFITIFKIFPSFLRQNKNRSIIIMFSQAFYNFSSNKAFLLNNNKDVSLFISIFNDFQKDFDLIFHQYDPQSSSSQSFLYNQKLLCITLFMKSFLNIIITKNEDENYVQQSLKRIFQYPIQKMMKILKNKQNQLKINCQILRSCSFLLFHFINMVQILDKFPGYLDHFNKFQQLFIYYTNQHVNNRENLSGQVIRQLILFKKLFINFIMMLIEKLNKNKNHNNQDFYCFVFQTVEFIIKDFQKQDEYSKNIQTFSLIQSYFKAFILQEQQQGSDKEEIIDSFVLAQQKFNHTFKRICKAIVQIISHQTYSNINLRLAFFKFISNVLKNKNCCSKLNAETLRLVIQEFQWALNHHFQQNVLAGLLIIHNIVGCGMKNERFQKIFVNNYLIHCFKVLFFILLGVTNNQPFNQKRFQFQNNYVQQICSNLLILINALRMQSLVKISETQTISNIQVIYNSIFSMLSDKFLNKNNVMHQKYLKKLFVQTDLQSFIQTIKDYKVLLHRRQFNIEQ